MPRIRQLPPLVVNKIAAGEVIERPASVLKELLENAIDAGARRVDVDVEQGGVELIRVADDVFRVRTLGFRGEALASIGGVAQVSLQSRPPDDTRGAEVACNGGDLGPVRPWNGSPGTRIEVKHLFFNTPVRRKFMRTPGTEMGHLSETFTRVALARPGLQLTLRHNGKLTHDIPASADLLERIGLFFG